MTGKVTETVPGLYGTLMVHEDAGGYVLVGVIAFTVAVIITVLCIRRIDKGKKQERQSLEE